MPVDFVDTHPQGTSAVVVCAGTVTAKTVSAMSAGFTLFKKLFSTNKEWESILQSHLNQFHQKKKDMPSFLPLGRYGETIGGIATVPCLSGFRMKGLKVDRNNYDASQVTQEARMQTLKEEYMAAVKDAIDYAKGQRMPLTIQPLGIGAYGWPPEEAAVLFHKAILEANTEPNKINIHILRYPSKNDKKFEKKFKAIADSAPKDIAERKQRLTTIVDTLISNIESRMSGKKSNKVSELKKIRDTIKQSTDLEALTAQIETVCKLRRFNPLGPPHSVDEYKALLEDQKMNEPIVPTIRH